MSISRASLAVLITVGLFHVSATAHAQVDFEGIWIPNNQQAASETGGMGGTGGMSGTGGGLAQAEFKLTPAGQAEFDSFSTENDPAFRCIMPGIPRGFTDPYPMEIIQQEHQIVLLYEYFHQVRRVFMDGREAPDYWPLSLSGYSTGYWDDDTLVVRTTHLSPDNVMDPRGRPFSGAEDTYVIERYKRSGDELTFRAEIHDPTYYEGPYVKTRRWAYAPDGEIWEYECDSQFGDVG